MTGQNTDPASIDSQRDSGASHDRQDLPADVEPPGATPSDEQNTTGFLFCLQCGTAMVGQAECHKCGFPRRATRAIGHCR